ncbi:hypothetical protein [Streptomyces phaeochromogenes]|uniref:hypothetical protein n=1 Tax=Streptomyces phaeochromogenes TaxID=1923 RepID=UPI003F4D4CCF
MREDGPGHGTAQQRYEDEDEDGGEDGDAVRSTTGPPGDCAVEVRGVRRQFGRGASAAHALRGSFTAETGPSGSAGPAGEPAGASAAPRSAPAIVILGPTTATVPARAGIRGTLDA